MGSFFDSAASALYDAKGITIDHPTKSGSIAAITYEPQIDLRKYPISKPIQITLQFNRQKLELAVSNKATLDSFYMDLKHYTAKHSKYLGMFQRISSHFVQLCQAAISSINTSFNVKMKLAKDQTQIDFDFDQKFDHLKHALTALCAFYDTLITCIYQALRKQLKTGASDHYQAINTDRYISAGRDVYGKPIGYDPNAKRVKIRTDDHEIYTFPVSAVKKDDSRKQANQKRIDMKKKLGTEPFYSESIGDVPKLTMAQQKQKYQQILQSAGN